MTWAERPLLIALLIAAAAACLFGLASASPKYTLLTTGRTRSGVIVAEPIYSVILHLHPENAVAAATGPGEALNCETEVQGDVIHLQCAEARFRLTGFRFQE